MLATVLSIQSAVWERAIRSAIVCIRVPVSAGPHQLAATFLETSFAESEATLEPFAPGGGGDGFARVAAIDVAGDALVHGDEDRYALLAAGNSRSQGTIIWEHVQRMRGLARAADRQSHGRWPRGASWN